MGLLLRGGLVADGVGATVPRADVLLEGDRITYIGNDLATGGGGDHEVIDLAPGSVVLPGFIDAHVHAESLLVDGRPVDGALAQGVTTLVIGQDGASIVGAEKSTVDYLNQYFGAVNGAVEPGPYGLAEFKSIVDGRLTQNVAVLACHGTIRHNLAGADPRPLDDRELAEATRQVERALADGAVGLSSGLEYVPGRFGDLSEITALARPLGDRPYVSHLRAYGAGVGPALGELVDVGHAAGIRVHASHLYGAVDPIEAAYRSADTRGVALSHDMYSYRRSSTIIAMLLLPARVQEGGPARTLQRLRDPGVRADILREPTFTDDYLNRVMLGCLPASHEEFAGLSITEAAARQHKNPGEWTLDLLLAGDLTVGGHLDRPDFDDDTMNWIVDHDRHCVGSDGIYQGQHPHPRGFGSFARLATHYGDYQRLARHAAARPAEIYGLTGRGRLVPGLAADITVIGPDGLRERATDAEPMRLAEGVSLVLVNGVPVWREGRRQDQRPGAIVSR